MSMSMSGEGSGPARQVRILAASMNEILRSAFTSFWQVRQWFGQRLIFTSPDCQLTSGLCSRSQLRPKMTSWLPRPVTANVARSVWSRYRRTASQTSDMLPASFSVPSTLYTGMGRLSFFVVSLFCCTKLEFTKRSVAPQSRRPFVDSTVPVSVVCIEIGISRDFEPGVVATTYRSGRRFSHFGRHGSWERRGEVGGVAFVSCIVVETESNSVNSSTGNAAKRLCTDSGGTPSTRCPCQNPASPLRSCRMTSTLLLRRLGRRTRPQRNSSVLRCPYSEYRIAWGNPFGCVLAGHIGSRLLL